MRIVAVATLASVVLGFLAVCVILLGDEPAATIRYSLTTENGLLSLLLIAALVSLPVSIPTGLAGGALAAWVVSKEQGNRALASWVGKGSLWGAGVGATATALAFAVPAIASDTFPLLLVVMALIGGTTGALVGASLGAYCSRVVRLRVANLSQ